MGSSHATVPSRHVNLLQQVHKYYIFYLKKFYIWKHGFMLFFISLTFTSSIWTLGIGKSFSFFGVTRSRLLIISFLLFVLFWKMRYLFGLYWEKNISFLDTRINLCWVLRQLSVTFLCSFSSYQWIFCSFIFFLKMHK